MNPTPVYVVGQVASWPSMVQAFGSITAIIVSVAGALFIQNYTRRKTHAHETMLQQKALIEITSRCVASIDRLHYKAVLKEFRSSDMAWLTDEITADVAIVDAIDVMALRSSAAIPLVSKLQNQIRTARRRLGYVARTLQKSEGVDPSMFEAALKQSREVLEQLTRMP